MKTKKLGEIFVYRIILSLLSTFISLYTAIALSDITEIVLDDISSDILSPILFFVILSLSLIVIRGLLSYFFSKREILVKQSLKIGLYSDFFLSRPLIFTETEMLEKSSYHSEMILIR